MSSNANTPLVNQKYWDELAGKENPTLEDYLNILQTAKDPTISSEIQDTLDIAGSVSDSMKYANILDKELEDTEKIASEAIENLDNLMSKDAGLQITKAYEEALKIINDENASEMLKKPMRDIINAVENNPELKSYIDTKGAALLNAENFAKDHPVMLKLYEAKQSLLDTVDDIKDMRNNIKLQTKQLINDCQHVAQSASIAMSKNYTSIKASVLESANRSFEATARCYNNFVSELEKFTTKVKTQVKTLVNKVEKFKDKFVDMISLGLHSKLEAVKTKDFYETQKNAYQEKLDNLKESYKAGAAVDKALESKLEKKISNLTKNIEKVEKKEAFRGVSTSDYWKDITDNAFLWGILSENGKQTGYARSPVQTIIDGANNAKDFTKTTIERIKDSYQKADSAFQKALTNIGIETRNTARNINLAKTNLFASTYSKIADSYEKKSKRIENKINQIQLVDEMLFKKKAEMQKVLHDLTEVTPFVNPPFEPNAQIVAQIQQLKQLNPKENPEIALSIHFLEKSLKKDYEKYTKRAALRQEAHEQKIENAKQELDFIEKDIKANLEEIAKATVKMQSLQDKAQKFETKENAQVTKATEILNDYEVTLD